MKRRAIVSCLLLLGSCNKEKRVSEISPALADRPVRVQQSVLQPGAPIPVTPTPNPYEGNYQAINEGKRLYSWYNCAGCHSPGGGGGMGPPLIDDHWIYGNQPANLYQTITQGRPNGMPAFGSKVSEHEVWQLVTYVRNMSAEASAKKGP